MTLKAHSGVRIVAFSPDGKRLASASEYSDVKLWDTATGQETLTLYGLTTSVRSVAFSPDGQYLVFEDLNGTVRVWDARPLDDKPAKTALNSR
jgi:WD40 repeat protein